MLAAAGGAGIHTIPALFIGGKMAIRGAAGADEVLAALRRAPASGSMRAFAME